MKTRIYIMACESEKRLVPTFQAGAGRSFNVGQHVMTLEELHAMTGEECRALLVQCVEVLPNRSEDYKFPVRTPDPVPDQGSLLPDGDPGYDPDDWRSSIQF